MTDANPDSPVSPPADERTLEAYKTEVRQEVFRIADDQQWPLDDLNDILTTLGFDPVVELESVDVRLVLAAVIGDQRSEEAFKDEETARATATDALEFATRYRYLHDPWMISDIRTVSRRTTVIDTDADGRTVHETTTTATKVTVTVTVRVTSKAAAQRLWVTDLESLTAQDRNVVTGALVDHLQRLREGYCNDTAIDGHLVDIITLRRVA